MTDLVVLSADVDIEASVEAILSRPKSLGIRPIEVELVRHPGHDPGVFHGAHELLRPYADRYERAVAVLDCAWAGNPCADAGEVEREIEGRLADHWGDRAAAVAIGPEVENWIWSPSPHVAAALGWPGDTASLRQWLEEHRLWENGHVKPADPKAALERACRECRTPASSALFRTVLSKVSLTKCTDPAFQRLSDTLVRWFGPD